MPSPEARVVGAVRAGEVPMEATRGRKWIGPARPDFGPSPVERHLGARLSGRLHRSPS